ncbi:hypothetical protein BDV25DRAFT_137876 [Aspergillus avenaceus]|uniref:Myb-like DNA-binding domain-containing protein n=1 Tax=Aspergillus avenaceus TaxID=36643 RepID=A0A5N6U196_ASPAV|nr:hypothetical protein BDV25DRAFT_137876 [Aspergillus avenaceus]
MSKVSETEQLQFLLSCIRHSKNGKVDFDSVAKECNIVTKGAASKRYERLIKASKPVGEAATASSITSSPVASPKKVTKSSPSKGKKTVGEKKATAAAFKRTPKKKAVLKTEEPSDDETEIDEAQEATDEEGKDMKTEEQDNSEIES